MSDGAPEALASRLDDLLGAVLPAYVVFAAVELRFFEHLDEPRTIADLARRSGATQDGALRLARALAALGLLRFEGEHLVAATDARAVLGIGPVSVAPIVRHHQRHLAPLLARLPAAVRGEGSQVAAWPFADRPLADTAYLELARHPSDLADFLDAMDRASRGVGTDLCGRVDLSGVRLLVDLGCGGGAVARELLAAHPALVVESYDLEATCEVARARSSAAGFGSRHSIRAGDLVRGVGRREADAVLLSAVLADWSSAERRRILAGARATLAPGGLLIVSETLLDDDERGPPKAAMFSLIMLLAMRGDQLSARQLVVELEQAGFTEPTVLRGGPRDLIVARGSP
jgi:predicted O-methyltransferase YrrM